ncbi:MAG: hypothetical protein ACXW2P_03565, partial [Thermoanaerobaculia bacterium]
MKAAARSPRRGNVALSALLILLFAIPATAANQLMLKRGETAERPEYAGVVDLTVDPGFQDARVWITIDGQTIAEGILWPHRVNVDFGPAAIEHKIAITAIGADKRRVQWHETINRGHLPLTVDVKAIDLASRLF